MAVQLLIVVLALSACSVKADETFEEAIEIDPTATPPPTATPVPDLPPEIDAPEQIRTTVGERVEVRWTVSDDTGTPVNGLERLAPGMMPGDGAAGSPQYWWEPATAGRWMGVVRAVDASGQEVTAEVEFVAQYAANPTYVIAMGDSVAAGHGLDVSDYATGDDCFRSGDGYPGRVVDLLEDADYFDGDTQLAVVACSAASTDEVLNAPQTGGFSSTVAGDPSLPQVEWAVRANPGLVLLTVGINDVGFNNPENFFLEDNTVDQAQIDEGLARMETGLRAILTQLVETTDAVIVVTEYYNPTAPNPQGFDGCRTDCFRVVTEQVVTDVNGRLAQVAASYDSERVVLVPLQDRFQGHGAPNGLGPDGLREGGFGILGEWAEDYLGGIQPYCARGDTQGDPWINNVDCVHPNDDGAQQIAEAIVASLIG